MKPVIIPRNKVLEVLFKGHEVLDISFTKNGKVNTSKLTTSAISTVRDIVESEDNSEFFVALVENEEDIPADTPSEEEPITPTEPENSPKEDNKEENKDEI